MTKLVVTDSARLRPPVCAAATVGCVALAVRPMLLSTPTRTIAVLAVLFSALLFVGLLLPVGRVQGRPALDAGTAIAIGVGAFALSQVFTNGTAPGRVTLLFVAANTLAAVAEEVWFRRLWFGLLEPGGVVLAVVGSAVLFALVHVALYGVRVFPVDLGAGLVLGWQRATTRSWHAPALTHAVANLLIAL